MVSTHIIYVPGLGDGYDTVRRNALSLWRWKHTTFEFLPMEWRNHTESYQQKLRRIDTAIENSKADRVVLVGESAGGSMVVGYSLKYSKKVYRCITICGKNVRADRVSSLLYIKNPAFKQSMLEADAEVGKLSDRTAQIITTFLPLYDPIVSRIDTIIPGANMRRLPTVGHLVSIFSILFILWPLVVAEAKRQV